MAGRGVALTPDLPTPRLGRFHPFEAPARIVCRTARRTVAVSFSLAHYNLADRTGRWRIAALIADAHPEDAPPGSELWVTEATRARLAGARPD